MHHRHHCVEISSARLSADLSYLPVSVSVESGSLTRSLVLEVGLLTVVINYRKLSADSSDLFTRSRKSWTSSADSLACTTY